MRQIPAREAISLLQYMTRVLCAVGIMALAFTTVNVTRFATSRDIPWPIAVLLDPMIGTALAGVLYVDARLAAWGIRPPAWSTALRWGAGCTAALMNSWESLWPDGQIGWPRHADPAAVLLHLTPALLLIALAETIAAYRRCVTDLIDRIGSTNSPEHAIPPTTAATRSPQTQIDPDTGAPDPPGPLPAEGRADHGPASATTSDDHERPHTGVDPHHNRPLAPTPPPASDGAADADLWPRAVALDDAARAATGKPVSVWKLRTDLRIGPQRARQIREQLLTRRAPPPPLGR
ncbi:extensin [Streptomyces sp. 7N604]|uniref:extensin n=1 Tax=Streptomyces sp. 7N604 TaxID=3457415 RepID=UPI003FD049C2